jgi:hypothetical protein
MGPRLKNCNMVRDIKAARQLPHRGAPRPIVAHTGRSLPAGASYVEAGRVALPVCTKRRVISISGASTATSARMMLAFGC